MIKIAYLDGINVYSPQYPSLRGCVNDIWDARNNLQAKGFDCTVANDRVATRYNVLNGVNGMVNRLNLYGGIGVWVRSCHGSQLYDVGGDEISDRKDEVMCTTDWPKYVSDDDVRGILNRLKPGIQFIVISDMCHAGSSTRPLLDAQWTMRSLPAIAAKRPKPVGAKAVEIVPNLNHIHIAACHDYELSAEGSIGGVVRGAFSYFFWKEIAKGTSTWQEVVANVTAKLSSLGLSQVPVLECTQDKCLMRPFV